MNATPELLTALRRVEELLVEHRGLAATDPGHDSALRAAMDAVEATLVPGEVLARDIERRLARVRGQCALQLRTVPAGALDGLYHDVRAAAAGRVRVGMSGAFLDAPRALARWRFTATAACLLLVIGGAFLTQERLVLEDRDGARSLHDPRDDLLQRLDGGTADVARSSDRVARAGLSGHAPVGRTGEGLPRRGPAMTAVPAAAGGSEGQPAGYARTGGHGTWTPLQGVVRSPEAGRARGGFFVFHMRSGERGHVEGAIQVDSASLLDAVGIRLRLVAPQPAAPTGRESN